MSARFGKPDKTGRSSGKRGGRDRKLYSPPKGEPWVWLTRELLASPAWRSQSPNARRLVDFLLIEHTNHAGTENGALPATHEQLEAYGLTKNCITPAIKESTFLGLIRFERGGRWGGVKRPSVFRLTFFADRDGNPPTNEWKGKTAEAIAEWKKDLRYRKKQFSARTSAGDLPALLRVVEDN